MVVPEDGTAAHLVSHENGRGFDASAPGEEGASALAVILGEMTGDRGGLRVMGDNAVKAVKENYDYRVRTEKLFAIYDRAIERSKRKA